MSSVDEAEIRHGYTTMGPVKLHYAEMGSGPLVVMLHGFPEAWFSYRHQIVALARAGYRAVAPDLRGFNLSDKPRGAAAYRAPLVASDIAGLVRELGASSAVIVGHDWGGEIAWTFAMLYPHLLDRLVIMNSPHPLRMTRAMALMPRQLLKSAYMYLFQLPLLPEFLLSLNDYAYIRSQFTRDPVRRDAFTPDDIERYVTALKQPGGLTGGLNYYRAQFRYGLGDRNLWQRVITRPVFTIWGDQDRYILRELAEPDRRLVPDHRVAHILAASHWVQNDQPEQVNRLLLDFLGSGKSLSQPGRAGSQLKEAA